MCARTSGRCAGSSVPATRCSIRPCTSASATTVIRAAVSASAAAGRETRFCERTGEPSRPDRPDLRGPARLVSLGLGGEGARVPLGRGEDANLPRRLAEGAARVREIVVGAGAETGLEGAPADRFAFRPPGCVESRAHALPPGYDVRPMTRMGQAPAWAVRAIVALDLVAIGLAVYSRDLFGAGFFAVLLLLCLASSSAR